MENKYNQCVDYQQVFLFSISPIKKEKKKN